MSETESQTVDSEDDASSVATHGSESPMTTDSETETEEEEAGPWMPMVEEAMQKHKAAFPEMKMNLIHIVVWMSKPLEKQLTLVFCLNSKRN